MPDKYAHIKDLSGGIPDDEPIFILRAQDILAPSLVRAWGAQLRLTGGHPNNIAAAAAADALADSMEAWPKRKVPDLAADSPRQIDPQRVVEALPLLRYILYERANQDEQWGGPAHDDKYTVGDFVSWMEKFAKRIQTTSSPIQHRDSLIKIAALALAALEMMKRRVPPFSSSAVDMTANNDVREQNALD